MEAEKQVAAVGLMVNGGKLDYFFEVCAAPNQPMSTRQTRRYTFSRHSDADTQTLSASRFHSTQTTCHPGRELLSYAVRQLAAGVLMEETTRRLEAERKLAGRPAAALRTDSPGMDAAFEAAAELLMDETSWRLDAERKLAVATGSKPPCPPTSAVASAAATTSRGKGAPPPLRGKGAAVPPPLRGKGAAAGAPPPLPGKGKGKGKLVSPLPRGV